MAHLHLQYKENLEMRMKYPDAPEKFLDSEVDLDELVKTLLQVGRVVLWSVVCRLCAIMLPRVERGKTHQQTGNEVGILCFLTFMGHLFLAEAPAGASPTIGYF